MVKSGEEVAMDSVTIPRVENFKDLDSIIKQKGDIDEDINNTINMRWQKWRSASGVLCDKQIPVKLKGKIYRMVVRRALTYRVVLANQKGSSSENDGW